MYRIGLIIIGLLGLFSLVGCQGMTNLVKELKEDPAIVGATGLSIAIGFDPTPETAMIPLPKVTFGHGAAWRVGIHDCVYISTQGGAGTSTNGQSAGNANAVSAATGQALLTISASGLETLKSRWLLDPNAKDVNSDSVGALTAALNHDTTRGCIPGQPQELQVQNSTASLSSEDAAKVLLAHIIFRAMTKQGRELTSEEVGSVMKIIYDPDNKVHPTLIDDSSASISTDSSGE